MGRQGVDPGRDPGGVDRACGGTGRRSAIQPFGPRPLSRLGDVYTSVVPLDHVSPTDARPASAHDAEVLLLDKSPVLVTPGVIAVGAPVKFPTGERVNYGHVRGGPNERRTFRIANPAATAGPGRGGSRRLGRDRFPGNDERVRDMGAPASVIVRHSAAGIGRRPHSGGGGYGGRRLVFRPQFLDSGRPAPHGPRRRPDVGGAWVGVESGGDVAGLHLGRVDVGHSGHAPPDGRCVCPGSVSTRPAAGGLLGVFYWHFRSGALLATAVLAFAASWGFYDYTAGGLENGLAYLMVAVFAVGVFRKWELPHLAMVAGLTLLVRHDLLLLVGPALAWAAWEARRDLNASRVLSAGLLVRRPDRAVDCVRVAPLWGTPPADFGAQTWLFCRHRGRKAIHRGRLLVGQPDRRPDQHCRYGRSGL